MSSPDLLHQARAWASADPDPTTREELLALIASADPSATDLADRFAQNLEFGTAGLRGVLGAGPNRMNRAVVRRTTLGLSRHLLATLPDAAGRGVVLGYDGRRMSRQFAEDAAAVLAAAGLKAHLFTDVCPTPLTAYAITALGCAAGVMITASHNPPEYNGYKAYWENGAQIVPPVDEAIARAIASAPPAGEVPLLPIAEARARGLVVDVPTHVERDYLARARALSRSAGGKRDLRVVYTPMHGVGGHLVKTLLGSAGFTNVAVVPEQAEPDGAFPTVAFPNPEEKGAMDLSFSLARKLGADLILANDPDADRLAVALPSPGSATGYVQLTGNQVGVLLGHYLLSQEPARGDVALLASLVSSPMLGVVSRELGAYYEETLTGFKWIANRAIVLEAQHGKRFLFGYEEALGYTVGSLVRDKDGVSAALLFAELTAVLLERGETVTGYLESLYRQFGLFMSTQVNLTRRGHEGAQEILAMMERLRNVPLAHIGDHAVVSVTDFERGTRIRGGGTIEPLAFPKSNVLVYELAGGNRVIARPSGTEPKVKFYVDVCEPMKPGESMADARARAETSMQRLAEAFVAIAVPR